MHSPRLSVVLLALAVFLACAPTASADRGSGLYEPFPEPVARGVAARYAAGLGVRVSRAELRDGIFVAATPGGRGLPQPRRGGPASVRAGVGPDGGGALDGWPLALAALALIGAGLTFAGRRRGAGVAVTAALALLSIAPPQRAAAAAPNPFVGITSEDAFAQDGAARDATLAAQAALGIGTIRQVFDWATIETSPGSYDFNRIDGFMASAATARIKVLPILFNPPAFRSRRPSSGARRATYPPRRFADLGVFAAQAARRYGPRGSFWAEHPTIPARPIRAWQIWNEPNLTVYWGTRPNARQYVRLLRAAARGLKSVDRGAEVVTAGMPQSHLGIPLATYVAQMYRAGGRSAFDTLAVNPYARTSRDVVAFLRSVRRVMNAHGDRRAHLWATEVGWADTGPGGPFQLGAEGQAREIGALVPKLWRLRAALRLRGFVYFNWRDAVPYPGGKDFWGLHTGLVSLDGQAKPALHAFASKVSALP